MFKQDQLPKLTPWTNWDEWTDVYRWLYSTHDPAAQAFAIKRINAWKSRGKVPVGVEATASFVEIILNDSLVRSDNEKRMMYSMALIRFINGVTEPLQNAQYAISINQLCARIGLPPGLADLRHQASHQQIPPLAVLRIAARQCLEWLNENYWKVQYSHLGESQRRIYNLLADYRRIRKSMLKMTPKSTEWKLALKESRGIVDTLLQSTTINQVSLNLTPILLSEGFVVPTTKKLRKFEKLPEKLWSMWGNLLTACCDRWEFFLSVFLTAIVDEVVNAEFSVSEEAVRIYRRSVLVCWFVKLLQVRNSPTASSNSECDIQAALSYIPVRSLLDTCLQFASEDTLIMARELASLVNDKTDSEKVSRLINAQQYALGIRKLENANATRLALSKHSNNRDVIPIPPDDDVMDLEQLEATVNKLEQGIFSPQTADSDSSGIWQPVKNIPRGFGIQPNGELPNLNLPVELDTLAKGRFLIPKSRQPDAPIAQQPYDQPPDSEYFDIANQSNREDSFGQTVGVMETVMTDDTPMREADVETTRPDLEDTSTVPLLISIADVIK